jgi:hypothetical protein
VNAEEVRGVIHDAVFGHPWVELPMANRDDPKDTKHYCVTCVELEDERDGETAGAYCCKKCRRVLGTAAMAQLEVSLTPDEPLAADEADGRGRFVAIVVMDRSGDPLELEVIDVVAMHRRLQPWAAGADGRTKGMAWLRGEGPAQSSATPVRRSELLLDLAEFDRRQERRAPPQVRGRASPRKKDCPDRDQRPGLLHVRGQASPSMMAGRQAEASRSAPVLGSNRIRRLDVDQSLRRSISPSQCVKTVSGRAGRGIN